MTLKYCLRGAGDLLDAALVHYTIWLWYTCSVFCCHAQKPCSSYT